MDKQTLYSYGFTILAILAILILLIAAPMIGNNAIRQTQDNSKAILNQINDYSENKSFSQSDYVTLTVHYSFSDHTDENPKNYTRTTMFKAQSPYNIAVPEYDGYSVSVSGSAIENNALSGVVSSDTDINVYYSKETSG